MHIKLRWLLGAAVTAALVGSASFAQGKTRVVVGTTAETAANPYSESNGVFYANGCQTYGCLGRFDYRKGEFVGMLAESWEVTDPTTWIFHLRDDVKWHNGEPVTAQDVVHSQWRRMNDPQSKQISNGKDVAEMVALDDHTLQVKTVTPTASLLINLFDRLAITNKKIYDEYGEEADRSHFMGFGPYRVVEVLPGQRIVLEKAPQSAFTVETSPDELIFRIMHEPEQRITALLKGEIQIAQYVPSFMVDRIKNSTTAKVAVGNSVEPNFLIMNPQHAPWDNKLLRQAVGYAIDKDLIIEALLGGLADKIDRPVGPGQYAYDPEAKPLYEYNPERARELVAEAGYPDGITVDFYTPVGRYINDKQTSEAIVGMLREVGINAQLKTPEWSTLWENVQQGQIPFYYMGRGTVADPSAMLSQYFETGVTKRGGYSNPEYDALLVSERAEFDPAKRVQLLRKAMTMLVDEAPAIFLWRTKLISGVSNNIEYEPEASSGVFGNDIVVKD